MNTEIQRRSEMQTTERLTELLESERKKPLKERDYDMIEQLCSEIHRLNAPEEPGDDAAEKTVACIRQRRNTERIRMRRRLIPFAACLALIIGCNAWSVRVYGMNLMQSFYEKISGGVQFRPDARGVHDANQKPAEKMREICDENGFSPLLPSYFPDGFILKRTETDAAPYADFCFQNGSQTVELTLEQFADDETARGIMAGFPSDQYCLREMQTDGTNILISWEDGQFTAVFLQNRILYTLFTENLEQQEAEQILSSFFDEEQPHTPE